MMQMSPELKYMAGMKYQLRECFWIETNIIQSNTLHLPFITLFPTGMLCIESGFSWDGASGPTIDTKSSFLGGLVHDALYRLMQNGLLDIDKWKGPADQLFRELLIGQGMWKWRANIWYNGVKDFGGSSAETKKKVKVIRLKSQ